MTTNTIPSGVATIPINGMPTTLLDSVRDEARAFRAQGTDVGTFLAEQLKRVAQLIVWTNATTPREFADRLEVEDAGIREQHFERGYAEGFEAGLRQARRRLA